MEMGDLIESYPRISAESLPEVMAKGLLDSSTASEPVIPASVAERTRKREDPIPLFAFLFGSTEKKDLSLPLLSAGPFPCGRRFFFLTSLFYVVLIFGLT